MKKSGLKSVTFYVLPGDYEALNAEAETHGVSLSAFIRDLVDRHSGVPLQQVRRRGGQGGNQNAQGRQRRKTFPPDENSNLPAVPETALQELPANIPTRKTATLKLRLRVENNNKFVRGKKRARENIERFHLQWHRMKKLEENKYELTFSYRDDADLDRQVYDLLREIESEADMRFCFIEADVWEEGTDRSW